MMKMTRTLLKKMDKVETLLQLEMDQVLQQEMDQVLQQEVDQVLQLEETLYRGEILQVLQMTKEVQVTDLTNFL